MILTLYQIDAFADKLFEGNPAAVCPLEEWLDDSLMQKIAAENNLSETAFFAPEGEGFRLRWFTPSCEVEFCGHATLASAFVIFSYGGATKNPPDRIVFETRRGRFFVEKTKGEGLLMNLPAEPHVLSDLPQGLAESLGAEPAHIYKGPNLMAVFDDQKTLETINPHMHALAELCTREGSVGIIVTAPGEGALDFVSRFFAPAHGIPEDPVTGSAHCMMAPYWAKRLGKPTLRARQISPRGGTLSLTIEGDRVLVEGACRLYMKGEIYL